VKRSWLIIALFATVLWFGVAIVRLENERYALELEICGRFDPVNPPTLIKREKCLEKIQTRTNPIYNLLYGLKLI
jgi:hypothetical protein